MKPTIWKSKSHLYSEMLDVIMTLMMMIFIVVMTVIMMIVLWVPCCVVKRNQVSVPCAKGVEVILVYQTQVTILVLSIHLQEKASTFTYSSFFSPCKWKEFGEHFNHCWWGLQRRKRWGWVYLHGLCISRNLWFI